MNWLDHHDPNSVDWAVQLDYEAAEWLVLVISSRQILGPNPADREIQFMTVWGFIAQSLLLSSCHHFDMA